MSSRNSTCDRVALVIPYGELSILPSVINSAQLLAEHGFRVDIIATASHRFSGVPDHDFGTDAVRVTFYQPGWLSRLKGIGWLAGIVGLSRLALRMCQNRSYCCFFGIDAEGLITAAIAGRRLGIPVIYHSLEIELSAGELRHFLKLLRAGDSPLPILLRRFIKNRLSVLFKKPMERWAHRQTVFTIALNDVRAAALLSDNRLPDAEVHILPPSPLAPRRELDREYLRRKYTLAEDAKILLQIGGISDVARSLELAQSARNWPDNWVLILHGFASDDEYLSALRRVSDGHQVILSTELVPFDELDDLVASADIGLALYRGIDLNYLHMASGKLLQYLKCGLPVIASDFPNMRDILESNRCGICVAFEDEIIPAATEILTNPDGWRDNASLCFRQNYDFGVHFAKIITRLEHL